MAQQIFDNPILYDKIAQELNVKLDVLGYIDDLYGVAREGFEEEDTFPEIYTNNGSKISLRVMPATERSLSFFIVTGEMVEANGEEFNFDVPMALIVWFNLLKVNPLKLYDYTSEIIKDVYNVLDTYGCFDIGVDINDVFSPFTMLEKQISSNLVRPYTGFKMTFNKTVSICN